MTRQVLFSSRAGNRWSFGVEFEGFGDPPRVWNEWWGSLWLWANGEVVGRPFEIEMVMSGFDPLVESLNESGRVAGNRASAFLASLLGNQALDLVMWSLYGDDDTPAPTCFDGDQSLLAVHEVLPRGSPFFDGWQAILIPEGSGERFVFRQEGGQAKEAKWPRGMFKSIALQARDEFKKLATANMPFPAGSPIN